MKNIERFTVQVESTHPEQQMLIAKRDGKQVFINGPFQDIFPTDTLLVYATSEENKRWGPHYRMTHYIEAKTENWLIKHLKYAHQYEDDHIIGCLLEPSLHPEMKHILLEAKQYQTILWQLSQKGVDDACLAKIENVYRWQATPLLMDLYQLLVFPSIQLEWLEEWIQAGIAVGKEETKAAYYIHRILMEANTQGHFCLPEEELQKRLQEKGMVLPFSVHGEHIEKVGSRWYVKENRHIERQIAQHIRTRLQKEGKEVYQEEVVDVWQSKKAFTLADNQKKAVLMALKRPFCVVTGGPGVGKTTVCRCITDILGDRYRIRVVAPTGRAARRAQESTGLSASTIHSLLEYNGVRYQRNRENPIVADALVVDESSMIDAPLLLALLEATPMETHIIFVGDVDQIPSVGPGQILKDIIASGAVPVTRLTDIFRQAADSPIIRCAYAINGGQMPECVSQEYLTYQECPEEWLVLKEVLTVGKKLYQEHHPFDVQILIPMYEGTVGIHAVNAHIQDHLLPDAPSVSVGSYQLRVGDKVIQTKNNKEKDICNGDVGIVTSVSGVTVTVRFQGHSKDIAYSKQMWHQLQLAYAVTVHRAQGSEYAYVIVPLVNSYRHMLQKNLLYTAITRAKKNLWILYQREAFEQAVNEESVPIRYTGLADALTIEATNGA